MKIIDWIGYAEPCYLQKLKQMKVENLKTLITCMWRIASLGFIYSFYALVLK